MNVETIIVAHEKATQDVNMLISNKNIIMQFYDARLNQMEMTISREELEDILNQMKGCPVE